jgi:hypothetical protein
MAAGPNTNPGTCPNAASNNGTGICPNPDCPNPDGAGTGNGTGICPNPDCPNTGDQLQYQYRNGKQAAGGTAFQYRYRSCQVE